VAPINLRAGTARLQRGACQPERGPSDQMVNRALREPKDYQHTPKTHSPHAAVPHICRSRRTAATATRLDAARDIRHEIFARMAMVERE
jgi:hypothetical protein